MMLHDIKDEIEKVKGLKNLTILKNYTNIELALEKMNNGDATTENIKFDFNAWLENPQMLNTIFLGDVIIPHANPANG
jgi:hypothetical protein